MWFDSGSTGMWKFCVQVVVNKFHQPRPEWYEEFYASQMDQGMRFYEDEVVLGLMGKYYS